LQFRTTKEENITFDIVVKHNQETINKSLSFVTLADVVIEPTITQSGIIKV